MEKVGGKQTVKAPQNRLFALAAIIVASIMLITVVADFYIDRRWFDLYGALDVFNVHYFARVLTGFALFAIFLIFMYGNLFVLKRRTGTSSLTAWIIARLQLQQHTWQYRKLTMALPYIVPGVIAFLFALEASSHWQELLLWLNAAPVPDITDPIFNKDLSFYFFTLPVINIIINRLLWITTIIIGYSGLWYYINGDINLGSPMAILGRKPRPHLLLLAVMYAIIWAFYFYYAAFDVMFSHGTKFFGAGYTATHILVPGYYICAATCLLLIPFLIAGIFKPYPRKMLWLFLSPIPVTILILFAIPVFFQSYIVLPDELGREKEYISYNINHTRLAYSLENLVEHDYPNAPRLTAEMIANNPDIISNIRLWDWRPLLQTFKQLQEFRPYYSFNDIDIDRYQIDGHSYALNIAARELDVSKLRDNASSWINTRLMFTHGYGVAASRVDRITPEGLPQMIVRDIPPQSDILPDFNTRPEIYFGEHRNGHIITNTELDPGEFDYPSGESNSYTRYEGQGGILLDSAISRLFAAASLKDINILISGNITDKSRLHLNRNIVEIAQKLMPFLYFDQDPYCVVINGKIYWYIDAYTASDRFPYSTPVKDDGSGLNYIRNSVKIIIDAYDGTMKAYLIDPADPVISAWNRIFPDLFTPFDEMPAEFKAHIRYPEDLFNIQARILLRYHVTDTSVFYNSEDIWSYPLQILEDSQELMNSYYLISQLPGEDNAEFVLMLPFTPQGRDNMISFLVARCDPAQYGKMVLYRLPKDRLSYGPKLIESRINQDAEISKQLTLWNQSGSRVMRGTMLVIPIDDTILYAEPLYLKATSSQMPELKRVIVSHGDSIAMEETLPQALNRLLGLTGRNNSEQHDTPVIESIQQLGSRAFMHLQNAEKALQAGDWKQYGLEMQQLRTMLQKMQQ